MPNARFVLAVLALAAFSLGCPDEDEPPPPPPPDEEDAGLPTGPADAGLAFIIQSADIPETGAPTVTFQVTDGEGQPVDLVAEITARTLTPRFTLAQLQPSFDYSSYYLGDVTGNPYILEDAAGGSQTLQPGAATTTQAIADPASGAFPMERLEDKGGGVYTYTFSEPTNRGDRTRTHTVAMWGRRTFQGQVFPASASFNFVPVGNSVQTDQTVSDQACNACHGILEAHDQRRGTQLCITCHNPGTTDPESGNTVDFKVMVHKIHRGESLPSVQNGGRYYIIGRNATGATPIPASSVHEWEDVGFPQNIRNCDTCHQGQTAARWNTSPSLEACTSCHDNVSFTDDTLPACSAAGRLTTTPCKHEGGLNLAVGTCALCHPAEKIQTYHFIAEQDAGTNFRFEILEVTNTAPGQTPSVKFRVVNPTTNTPYDLKPSPADAGAADAGTAFNPWSRTATGDSRLFIDLAWPSQEYTNEGIDLRSRLADGGSNAEPGSPLMLDALATAVANGDGTYTVTSPTAVPAGLTGSGTAVLEGHPAIPDPSAPGSFLRVPVTNAVTYFAITDATPQPRRQVVSVENCNVCHRQLTAHGSNRTGNTDVCPVCHNPNATDLAFRSSYVEGEEATIDFKVMIHQVHAAQIRNTPVIITGFRGSQNEFPLPFPGDVANCRLCHIGTTYTLPLQPFVLDTTIDSKGNNDPADNVRRPKQAAVCTSCHDTVQFSGTDPACTGPNTPSPCLHSAGAVGETADCAVCHTAGQPGDVNRVHRIQQ